MKIVRRKRMFVEQQKLHFKHDSQTHCQLKYRMPSRNHIQYKFIPFQCTLTWIRLSAALSVRQTQKSISIFKRNQLSVLTKIQNDEVVEGRGYKPSISQSPCVPASRATKNHWISPSPAISHDPCRTILVGCRSGMKIHVDINGWTCRNI